MNATTACTRTLLTLGCLLASQPAHATGLYWNGSGNGWDETGSWDTGIDGLGGHPVATPGAADVATFCISPITETQQTVSLNASQWALGLLFRGTQSETSVLQGGGTNRTLTLGAGGIIVENPAGAVTIGSAISNENVLVSLAAAQAWTNHSPNALTIPNAVSQGANLLTIDGAGDTAIHGVLGNGTGGLTKTGDGTLTLSGANTYGGTTTISGGTLKLGAANVLPEGSDKGNVNVAGALDLSKFSETINGLSGTGTVDTVAGGTPTLTVGANDQTSTFSGTIKNTAGTLALSKTGTGTLALTSASTYSGGTTISAGILSFTSGSLGAAGSITMAGGTLQWRGHSTDVSSRLVMVNGITATLDTMANDVTFAGPIGSSRSASLTKSGGGKLSLNGAIRYTGDTTINAGTLDLSSGTAVLPAGGTLTVGSLTAVPGAGATLDLANGTADTTPVGGLAFGNRAVLSLDWNGSTVDGLTTSAFASTPDAASYVGIKLYPTNNPATPSQPLLQAKGGLNANYLSVNNTDYTATLAVTDTLVKVASYAPATPLATAYWKGELVTGAPFGMSVSDSTSSNWTTDAAGTLSTRLIPGASTDVSITSAAVPVVPYYLDANMTLKSLALAAGNPSVDGPYTLTLTPTNPAKGLTWGCNPNINTAVVLGADQTWTSAASGNALRTNGTIFTKGKTLTVDGAGIYYVNATTPVPAFDGSGKLIKNGSGTMSFENSSSPNWTGDIEVNAGTLQGKGANSLGASLASRTITVNTGAYLVATNFGFFGNDPNAFPLIVCNGGTLNCLANGGYAVSHLKLVGGTLQGGQDRGANADSWTILGTVISQGASSISYGTGTQSKRCIRLANGPAGFDVQSGTLTASALLQNYNNSSTTPSTLHKFGAGTMVLSGPNTYSGGTFIAGGTLAFAAEGNLGATPATATPGYMVIDGGTLLCTASPTLSASRGIALGPMGASGPGTISVAASQTLTISGSVSDNTSGAGALVKEGPGKLALSGGNTYSGDTTVSAGTLRLAGANPNNETAAVRIAATGATLELGFSGTDTVEQFHTGTSQMPAGIYKAVGNPASGIESSKLSGSGTLTVTTGPTASTPYGAWASARGLDDSPGKASGTNDDPDRDDRSNLDEFGYDGDPLSGTNEGKVIGKVATLPSDDSKVLTLTLPVRRGASFSGTTEQVSALIDGVVYTIQGSDTLDAAAWTLSVTEITGADALAIQAGLPALSDLDHDGTTEWTYRSFRSPGTLTDGDPSDFLRAKIIQP
jgi:autotransporter-associated beta strand protein